MEQLNGKTHFQQFCDERIDPKHHLTTIRSWMTNY